MPQFPEAVVGGNSRDRCFRTSDPNQRAADKVHSPQGEIPDRTHSQMLFASGTKGALGDADGRANLRQVQRPALVCFQIFLELRNDPVAAPTSSAPLDGSPIRQTSDHQVGKFLFQCPCHLGGARTSGFVLAICRGSGMRVQQPRHQNWTWPNQMRQRFFWKFMTGDGLAHDVEIIERQ